MSDGSGSLCSIAKDFETDTDWPASHETIASAC